MESLAQIGVFLAEAMIVVLAFVIIIIVIASAANKGRSQTNIRVEPLNEKFKDYENLIKSESLNKQELKEEKKKLKELEKKEEKSESKPRLFVIDFDGDIKASQADNLKEEINAILTVATAKDEVVVRLESPGGVVHGYGFAASQLLRLREKNIPLTICIDQVAASGGYLMSCVAHKILAAPFAIVGSIGVVAQVPNFNKILKKHDVEFKEYTAGEFKRTVTLFGEITPKGEQKFVEQLEETHQLFKSFVSQFRPQLDMSQVATGEYWYGQKALELKLVDAISTSDDYLLKHSSTAQILHIKHEKKPSFQEKISQAMGSAVANTLVKVWTQLEKQKHM